MHNNEADVVDARGDAGAMQEPKCFHTATLVEQLIVAEKVIIIFLLLLFF